MIKENRMKFVPRDNQMVYVRSVFDNSVMGFLFDSGDVGHLELFYNGKIYPTAEKALKYANEKHERDCYVIEYKDAVQADEMAQAKKEGKYIVEHSTSGNENVNKERDKWETEGETIIRAYELNDGTGVFLNSSNFDSETVSHAVACVFGQVLSNFIFNNKNCDEVAEFIDTVIVNSLIKANKIIVDKKDEVLADGGALSEDVIEMLGMVEDDEE